MNIDVTWSGGAAVAIGLAFLAGGMIGAIGLAALAQGSKARDDADLRILELERERERRSEFALYERDTERTGSEITLEQGAMKIAEEAGEVVGIVSKGLYQGHPIDKRKLEEELGDLLFYIVRTGAAYGIPFTAIAAGNIEKRLARFPKGFTAEDSIARRDQK